MAICPERILSIQSHVVFGYVGGKAAVFPLQCLGYDVDVVNTVNFSNHAGYGRSGGSKTTAAELNSIFESMEQNELMLPSRLLTGYIPGAEALSAVADLAAKLKQTRPGLIYLLDPVMGDAGRLYVAADVIPVYRTMLPLATIITPNWFEVELLTDIKLRDLPSLQQALAALHTRYTVPHVVISSIPATPWLWSLLPTSIQPAEDSEYILCLTSSLNDNDTRPLSTVHAQCVSLIPGYFSGVGDLFSALLLGHFHPDTTPASSCPPSRSSTPPTPPPPSSLPASSNNNNNSSTPLSIAASKALLKTHALLQRTHVQAARLPLDERLPSDDELDAVDPLRKTRRMRGRELVLVQGQDVIRAEGLDETRALKLWDGFWEGYTKSACAEAGCC